MNRKRIIFVLLIILLVFGLIMVGSASVVDAARDFGDKMYYLKLQALWAVIGLIGFFIASKFPHVRLEKISFFLFAGTIFLLLAVLIPGVGVKLQGARRWINLGFTTFQPAELAKLTLAVYFSTLLKKRNVFMPFLISLGLVIGLVMLEPDLGTSLVLVGMAAVIYFGGQGKVKNLLYILPVGITLGILLVVSSPYRLERIRTFLDYSHDPQGSSYQIRQSLLALGSGGLWGRGVGQSLQKYDYLPEVTTDSIFAVIGEEFGFFGGTIVILVFLAFIYEGFQIAKYAETEFSRNLALSITAIIGFQVFLNLSAITALLPFTGIPLTFISYGGSSLSVMMVSAGILANIDHEQKTYVKHKSQKS